MIRKLIIGVFAGAIILIIGMLMSQLFQFLIPSIQAEYENQNLFRSWNDPLMSIYFVEPFLTGIILVWIWEMTKEIIPFNNQIKKGACFGLIYWITTIPGMVMSYASFPLSLGLVCVWSITIFIQAIAAGIMFSILLNTAND